MFLIISKKNEENIAYYIAHDIIIKEEQINE